MGSSMAQLFAAHDYKVTLYDVNEEALDKSLSLIRINQESSMAEGDLTQEESDRSMAAISFTCDKECFKTADFVIEAIIENMNIKHSFWAEVSELVSETTVLTSNTSGLSLTEMAQAVKYPERFCGMHWLNPPHICPLVEVIRGERTSETTADIVYKVAEDIGRFPVRLQKEVPDF